MATRFGTSRKTKHIELRFLYVQELVGKGRMKLRKIGTKDKRADVLTKYLGTELLRSHLKKLCVSIATELFELISNFQSFTFTFTCVFFWYPSRGSNTGRTVHTHCTDLHTYIYKYKTVV